MQAFHGPCLHCKLLTSGSFSVPSRTVLSHATSAFHSPPRPGCSLRGLGRGALFSVWTPPYGRGRGPAAWWPLLVSGWSRVELGGRGFSLSKLLFFLPTSDSVWFLFFWGLQWGGRELSICPLANLRVAGFPQFLGRDTALGLPAKR